MSNKDDFLARLNPKLAKAIQTAEEVETIRYPLASIGLTHALGGGIGAGRVGTIFGNQSAGKSMLTLQSIGELQKAGLVCAFADVEGTYDKEFGAKLGINNSELFLTRSKSSGRLSDTIIPWIEAELDLLIIDSISDILPESFVDKDGTIKDADDRKQIGAQAKAITNMINAIHYSNKKTAVLLLSQTTTKMETWGTVQVPHGGNKVLFGSSQIVKLQSSNTYDKAKKRSIPQGNKMVEQLIGRPVEAKVEKNKLGNQSTTAKYNIYYAGDHIGIDQVDEMLTLGIQFGTVKQSGSWFSYGEDVSAQGQDKLAAIVRKDHDLRLQIKSDLEQAMNEKPAEAEAEPESAIVFEDGPGELKLDTKKEM